MANTLAELIVKLSADLQDYDRKLVSATQKFQNFGNQITAIGTRLGAAITLPIVAFGTAAISAAADLDALKRALLILEGTTEGVNRRFAELREIAKAPGIGLEEAVRADVRLRQVGNSAERASKIMREFANAIAAAGGSKEDFAEVLRQFTQIEGRGKITMDNLKIILERIPQAAGIIQREFGTINAEVLATKVTVKELGETLLTELGKTARVTSGAKNEFENLKDTMRVALADVGNAALPVVERSVRALSESAQSAAKAFRELTPQMQGWAIAVAAGAAVIPVLITGLGILVTNLATVYGAMVRTAGFITASLIPGLVAIPGMIKNIAIAIQLNMIPALTAGEARLLAFGKAAAVVVGILAVLKMDDIAEGAAKASEDERKATSQLETALKRTAESLAKQRPEAAKLWKEYELGAIKIDALSKKLRELAISVGDGLPKAKASGEPLKTSGFDDAGKRAEAYADAREANIKRLDEELAKEIAFRKQITQVEHDSADARIQLGGRLYSTLADYESRTAKTIETVTIPAFAKVPDAVKNAMTAAEQNARRGAQGIRDALQQIVSDYDNFNDILSGIQNQQRGDSQVEDLTKKTIPQLNKAIGSSETQFEKLGRQVSTIMTDMSRGIAKVIVEGGKMGDVFKRVASEIAQAIIRLVIESALKQLEKALSKILDQLGSIGKSIKDVFGIGASAGGGAAKTASSQTPGVGGASAASGAAGWVSAISGAVTAVSSVVGNFQMAGMNKSLDLIEHETRYSQIHLQNILEKLNQHLPGVDDLNLRMNELLTRGMGVFNAIGDAGLRVVGGNFAADGGGGASITLQTYGPVYGTGGIRQLAADLVEELKRMGVKLG